MLRAYSGLTDLNLADNKEITDKGAVAIAEGLAPDVTKSELTTLNLWGVKKIGQEGVLALTEASESHPSLVTVIIQPADGVDPALSKRMQMALGRNKKNKEYGLNPDGTKKPAEKINTIAGHRDGGRSMKSEL